MDDGGRAEEVLKRGGRMLQRVRLPGPLVELDAHTVPDGSCEECTGDLILLRSHLFLHERRT